MGGFEEFMGLLIIVGMACAFVAAILSHNTSATCGWGAALVFCFAAGR